MVKNERMQNKYYGIFYSKDMYDYVQNIYVPIKAQSITNATIQVNIKEPIAFQATMKGLKNLQ